MAITLFNMLLKILLTATFILSITALVYSLLISLTFPAVPQFTPQPLDLRGNPGLKTLYLEQQTTSQSSTDSTLYERFTTYLQEQEGIIFQIFNFQQAIFYSGTFYVAVMGPLWLWKRMVLARRERERKAAEVREHMKKAGFEDYLDEGEGVVETGKGKRKWDSDFELGDDRWDELNKEGLVLGGENRVERG